MKIVLDTNVFISGIFFSGPPSQILKAWKDQKIQIVLSKEILNEYQRVAEELSKKISSIDIEPIIELLTIYGEIVETESISVTVCEDPDDNMFLECAIASNSKIIVSGDKHLLQISGYQGIDVVKPREFIDDTLK
jgi:putative PIN family toxin of toxin-antitoxin system